MINNKKEKVLKLTLKLPQSINHIYGHNKFGSTYLKAEGKQYKEEMIEYIAMEAMHQDWTKVENQFLYMDEVVFMNKKGRDADNLKKLTQDVISESRAVWTDDTYCLPHTKRIYIDKDNPRLEIEIRLCPYIGVFDNEEELINFKDTFCLKCAYYQKRVKLCDILTDSEDDRIRNEMTRDEDGILECSKFKVAKVK